MSDADPTADIRCEPFGEQHVQSVQELFERAGSACHCEWWHFEGDKNAWLARLAHEPEKNRAGWRERAQMGGLEGVVAVRTNGQAVGWMKVTPAARVPKLYAQRPYRALSVLAGDHGETFTIGCFLVDPEWRKRGVARALLGTGVELTRAAGARAIEAFPRRAEGLGDEEAWTGPYALFEEEGFSIVHDLSQYPVMRRML